MQLLSTVFKNTIKTLEIGPDVFMEYRLIQLLWLFRFSTVLGFYEDDDGNIYPLRPADIHRLTPSRQIPWLDRWGWGIVVGIVSFGYYYLKCGT